MREDHQSKLQPSDNKFHQGNGEDGKHYWLTPPDLYDALNVEFHFDFDPCPFPLPDGFDGLTCEWGKSNYVNPPFGSIIHQGKKKGPTAWVRKAIEEYKKGKRVVLVYPVDKWVLMLMKAILGDHAHVRNLGDVRWLATEDGSQGKGTGRHIACFILDPNTVASRGAGWRHTEEEYRDMIEMLLGCLANQKFIHEAPSCGDEADMAINDPDNYKATKQGIQAAIDDWYKKGWEMLAPPPASAKDTP